MGDLTKAKISQENVSDSRQLTTLIKELQNSMRSLQSVDDYLTRVSKAKEILGNDHKHVNGNIVLGIARKWNAPIPASIWKTSEQPTAVL